MRNSRVKYAIALVAATCSAGCNLSGSDSATLYRNSSIDSSMRIHFATFDAPETAYYNMSNCQMAARLLNANVNALAADRTDRRDQSLGFWCESGEYTEGGSVPFSFHSEWPTDAY